MEDRDDMPQTPLSMQRERERTASMRAFTVVMSDGSERRVIAHYWDNTAAGGHLNFYTFQPSGRTLIHFAIGAYEWREVIEVTPHDVAIEIDRIASRQMARQAGQRAFQASQRSSRKVH